MKKLIIITVTAATLLSAAAPAFAWCYPNGYCIPICSYVMRYYGPVYVCE